MRGVDGPAVRVSLCLDLSGVISVKGSSGTASASLSYGSLNSNPPLSIASSTLNR